MKVFLNFLVKLSINQENTLYLLDSFYGEEILKIL